MFVWLNLRKNWSDWKKFLATSPTSLIAPIRLRGSAFTMGELRFGTNWLTRRPHRKPLRNSASAE